MLRAAADLVGGGHLVALRHRPADAPESELRALLGGVHAAGLAAHCDLVVPVDRLGADVARAVAGAAAELQVGVVLDGAAESVDRLRAAFPNAAVVVRARGPAAEQRCRDLAGHRIELAGGRGAAAALTFVRCLTVLMSAPGYLGVGTADPRLLAIAGERAAWNERTPDSWEHVMPYGIRVDDQRRLVAAGHRVRVRVSSGAGAGAGAARLLAERWGA